MALRQRRVDKKSGLKRGDQKKGNVSGRVLFFKSYFTPYWVGVAALALTVAVLHSIHLHILFENDRFFSHLSPLERELSFRTEMGLYYSYYKTLVTAPSFSTGFHHILQDNLTEYPSTINTLRRFNLYPEVVLGALFRGYRAMLDACGLTGVQCFTITRGYGQPPVQTCTGLGDPAYFYVDSIFLINGLLASVLFLLGAYLGRSVLGGVLVVLAFFYNHGEATRVMWTPPLRESFAMPFLMLEMLAVTHTLRHNSPQWWLQGVAIAISALGFMLPWQFAQFTLLTQTLSLVAVYSLRLVSANKLTLILSSIVVAFLLNVLLQFGNTLLLTSTLACCLLCSLVVISLHRVFNKLKYIPLIAMVEVCCVLVGSITVKTVLSRILGSQDDAHIGALLLSKFTSYQDFHTQLYTCAAEFDFLSPSYALALSVTLLLPVGCVLVGVVVWRVVGRMREWSWRVQDTITTTAVSSRKIDSSTDLLPEQCYHVVQCASYAVMAVLIMRLKLFLTPQLALLTALTTTLPKVTWFARSRGRLWLVALLLVGSSMKGVHNLWTQWSIIGEFNNPDQEELILWVNSSTHHGAVFAGSMPTMAAIKLSTERPIVIHPHYEDAGLRNRTKNVYTIFSRKPPSEVHSILSAMAVNYVIVEEAWCTKQYRPGCAFYEVWDVEDPANQDRPVFCQLLHSDIPPLFKQVFLNKTYRVLLVQ